MGNPRSDKERIIKNELEKYGELRTSIKVARYDLYNSIKYLFPHLTERQVQYINDCCFLHAGEKTDHEIIKNMVRKPKTSHIKKYLFVLLVLLTGFMLVNNHNDTDGAKNAPVVEQQQKIPETIPQEPEAKKPPVLPKSDIKQETVKQERPQTPAEASYIANARSGVFHRDGCQYVKRMKPSNMVEYLNRDKAIGDGYRPCKVCRP